MEYINHKLRGKAFALVNELANHCGYNKEKVKGDKLEKKPSAKLYDQLKEIYLRIYDEPFSLKDGVCTIEDYDAFINMLIEKADEVDCTFDNNPIVYVNDVEAYLVKCIELRRCCLTFKPMSDIHEVLAIGMGNDRTEVDKSKFPRMALCREKHQESHLIGQQKFAEKYHVFGVYCKYHNNKNFENGVGDSLENSDIKMIRYQHVRELLGVQFKEHKEGCNDKNVIVYRMTGKEYDRYINADDQVKYFYENVFNEFEIVEVD